MNSRVTLPHAAALAVCIAYLVCLLWPATSNAQAYGLTARQPIGPFLNNRLPSSAPSATTGWSTVPAFPNLTFNNPTFLTAAPRSNRLYVCSQWGRIYSFVNDPATTASTLVLDISNRVQASDSSGLLGMAFHPEFGLAGSPNRGYIYIYYQYSPTASYGYQPCYNRLSRFTIPDGSLVADPNSETILIQQYDPEVWHSGGGMFFDEQGFLYLSVGDVGGFNDNYNVTQRLDFGLFSGVLRIDVDMNPARSHPIRRQPRSINPSAQSFTANYYIPNDNPFVDPSGANLEEFWAIGLRSPHRMTYDRIAREIWVGDVGNNSREEVDVIVKGGNYQWPYLEGTALGGKPKPDPLIGVEHPPAFDYRPLDGNNCVIGGYVYRGRLHAAYLDGLYIFGDNGSGRIWALAGNNEAVYLCNMPPGSALTGLSSFGEDLDGELYMCQMGTNGRIYKLARSSSSAPLPPALLSQTGAFSNLATLTPAPGLIPYDVNSPLWSDGAAKRRWIAVPNDGAPYSAAETIGFTRTGEWSFPAGTVFVKHFELPLDERNPSVVKRLETRFLVRSTDGAAYGLTYKWRDDGSDADLLPGSLNEDLTIRTASGGTRLQTWFYPSRQSCLSCHTEEARHVLGGNTRQLNGNFTYPTSGVTDNQLRTWNHLGLFSPALNEAEISSLARLVPVTNTTASLEHRVRSYIDANCAHCHRPNGVRGFFDARFDTPLIEQRIVEGPVGHSLGVEDAQVIAPRDVARSIMHRRMNTTEGIRMPPLARNIIDVQAVSTLEQWIATLQPSQALPAPWANRDIGFVNFEGSVSYTNGSFRVNGSGEDIWGTADSFQFVYQPWTGDGEIIARVTAMQDTDGWAKAGVMFRQSLTADSRNALMCLTPANGAIFQHRAATTSSSSLVGGYSANLPVWVRLVRAGSTFRGYYSVNGGTWTLVESITIDMPATIYVGLAVTSHSAGQLCTATFDNVRVATVSTPGAPAAPSGLNAIAASSARIDLTWTDNSADETGFAIERSTDGTTFQPLATVPANTTAYAATGLSASTTYTFRVYATGTSGNSAPSNLASATTQPGTNPPPGWTGADIGAVGLAGSEDVGSTTITLRGSGSDIWNTADGFRFLYRSLTGDGFIEARVVSLTQTDAWAKAGVMLRESLAATAPNTAALVTATQGVHAQNRATSGAATTGSPGPGVPAPYWVRLARTGNSVVASASSNGVTWTTIATHSVTSPTVFIGLAVTAHNNAALSTATFDNVRLSSDSTPTVPAAPTSLAATAVSATRIDLAWTDNSTNEEGFALERSTDGTTFTALATVPANATTYSDTTAAASTTYTYRARATHAAGNSSFSNTASATTPPSNPTPGTWSSADVGAVGIAGSSDTSSSTLTLRGSGADIWGTADGFRFVYRTLTGDCSIEARVVSLTNTNAWAKAGVMIRDALTAGSVNTAALVTAANGANVQHRASAGANTTSTGGPWNATAPYWVRLVRTGNTIAGAVSSDGIAWMPIASHTVSSATMHVGLVVTSHNNAALATAVFDNVRVTGGAGPEIPDAPTGLTASAISPSRIDLAWTDNFTNETGYRIERSLEGLAFEVTVTPPNATSFSDTGLAASTTYTYRIRAALGSTNSAFSAPVSARTPAASDPGEWSGTDVGSVGLAGSHDTSSATLTLRGSGADIWNTADGFRFLYRTLSGDCSIEARVVSLTNTHAWAKAGVMIRDALTPGARNSAALVTAANGITGQQRATTGATTVSTGGASSVVAPYWVRLVRTGDTIVASTSANGTTWIPIGTHTLSTTAPVFVGLALTSHNNAALATATFDNVRITGGSTPTAPAAPTGLAATAMSSSQVDLRWTDQSTNEESFGIERSTDGTNFLQIATALPNATTYSDTTTAASTSYNYRVRALHSAGNSAYSNSASVTTPASNTFPPPANLVATAASSTQIDLSWTDTTANEDGFSIERSTDGATFTQIATTPTNVTSFANTGLTPSTTYTYRVRTIIGIRATDYSNSATATTTSGGGTPAWSHVDVGAVGVPGSDDASGNTITVRGSGNDIWDTADGFRFLYRTITGDSTIEAQVSSLTNTHPWAKAGVMIRESTAATSRNVFVLLTPSNGVAFQSRPSPGAVTSFTAGPYVPPPYWVRLVRTGNTFTAFASPNGVTWTPLGSLSLTMSATVHVGFAVTSHNNSILNTAVFSDPLIQ